MKKIPRATNLWLFPDGRLWSSKHKRVMKVTQAPTGYLVFNESISGKVVSFLHHRAVWETFKGPIPIGQEINHKNGIKTDNRLCNLELVTPKENAQHYVTVLGQHGDKKRRKLTVDQLDEIRKRLSDGESLKNMAPDFGVTDRALSNLTREKSRSYKEHAGTFKKTRIVSIQTRKRGNSFLAWFNESGKQISIGSRRSEEEISALIEEYISNNSARTKWKRK